MMLPFCVTNNNSKCSPFLAAVFLTISPIYAYLPGNLLSIINIESLLIPNKAFSLFIYFYIISPVVVSKHI